MAILINVIYSASKPSTILHVFLLDNKMHFDFPIYHGDVSACNVPPLHYYTFLYIIRNIDPGSLFLRNKLYWIYEGPSKSDQVSSGGVN